MYRGHKRIYLAALAILILGVWSVMAVDPSPSQLNPLPRPESEPNLALRIVFGLEDTEPTDWSGTATSSTGKVSGIEGWHFSSDDKIEGKQSWRCSTKKPLPTPPNFNHPREFRLAPPYPFDLVGVVIRLSVPTGAKLTVDTASGSITLVPDELRYGTTLKVLGGKARVERVPVASRITDSSREDDFPALTYSRDGKLWLAWIGYADDSDQVFLRASQAGVWQEPIEVGAGPGDRFKVGVAEDGSGRIWVVWSEFVEGNWDLYGRNLENGRLSETVRLTEAPGPDISHELVADSTGKLWLVWQSFGHGRRSDVCLQYLDGDRWSDVVTVSGSEANDWEPSVTVNSSGDAWVVWDSYERGNYDVMARKYSRGKLGKPIPVARSQHFEAYADAAFDPKDRLWIAWDEGEAHWGKDFGFYFEGPGDSLYRSRRLRVACILPDGTIHQPASDIMDAVPAHLRRYCQRPRIQADSQGGVWLFFWSRTSARLAATTVAAGVRWEAFATYYHGGRWTTPIPLPNSVGRNHQPVAATVDGGGYVWSAWPSNDAPFGGNTRPMGSLPRNHNIYVAVLDLEGFQPGRLALERVLENPDEVTDPVSPVHPDEIANVQTIRDYRLEIGGKEYRIYRGEMHRHTDISQDGGGDGSLLDFYRYCMDAADLDFGAVTDHVGAIQPYLWWLTMKSADLFFVPGVPGVPGFTPLYAYERSLPYPNGHRNVVLPQRTELLKSGRPEALGEKNTGPILYPYLKQNNGIAMSHTSATNMGTDWRDNDPEVEPLVEIFQGMRNSYEYEGAPLAATADDIQSQPGGFREKGFVWHAWAKGYKLGVQASSDHLSTHVSYACVYAEDQSRKALLDAMNKRHSYAATDNIILDFRMNDSGNTFMMGDIFQAQSRPTIWLRAVGTGKIKRIDIVKDNSFIYTAKPLTSEYALQFSDTTLEEGESYYYVRVLQENGQVAWSSPIWVTYSGSE